MQNHYWYYIRSELNQILDAKQNKVMLQYVDF